ncbi:MAG: glycosyltransferase [Ilumatobacteraceae bacterium]|nr:glycosyltransferase [Ilumatobacteraceae bacterium]
MGAHRWSAASDEGPTTDRRRGGVRAQHRKSPLNESVNIIIVGGNIEYPSADEQSTIECICRAADGSHTGLVSLAGHLPPDEVHDLLAFSAAHRGVYVCASDKEEFGLVIVEALGAGLVVVAPQRGGPRTVCVGRRQRRARRHTQHRRPT